MIFDQQTDEQLVNQAQQGQKSAVSKLYNKYIQPIYRFCYWQTNASEDAEDLTQQVFIEMIESINTFKGNGSFKNWLYTLAKRRVLAWIREKYRLPKLPLIEIGKEEDWLVEDAGEKKQKAVQKMLKTLSSSHRNVLELRYLRGYSVAETAKALTLTQSNVKISTKRALAKLAKTCNLEDTV